jgi:hypothetical protein
LGCLLKGDESDERGRRRRRREVIMKYHFLIF